MHMPDVWGEGAVFGYPASADTGLHGRLCGNRIAVEFDSKAGCTLAVDIDNICDINCTTVLPDCLELTADDGSSRYGITIAAVSADGVFVHCDRPVELEVDFCGKFSCNPCEGGNVYTCEQEKFALIKCNAGGGVAYGFAAGDSCLEEAGRLCRLERDAVCSRIVQHYSSFALPDNMSDAYRALYIRSLGVIEQGVSSHGCFGKRPGGKFRADVVSSLLCAVALRNIYPQYAKATLLKIADHISADGFLPACITESCCADAAPPFICYCFEQIAGNDKSLVNSYYDKLRSCIMYFAEGRDINRNYTYQWRAGGASDPGAESAMPNSPRFDSRVMVSGPDLSAYMYMAALAMGRLSRTINRNSDIIYWGVLAQRIANGANSQLFDRGQCFYYDRPLIGSRLNKLRTTAGFMPLYAGIVAQDCVAGMVAHLDNPSTFGCKRGIPSVARNEAEFCQDLYRGSISLADNYKILCALVQLGYQHKAADIAARCLDTVRRAYESDGVLYEYYSSDAKLPHYRQKRFGKSISPACRTAFEHTRDCTETAALVVAIADLLSNP